MKLKTSIFPLIFFILLGWSFFYTKTAVAESIKSEINYSPTNIAVDPWQGGNLTIQESVSVKANEIMTNPPLGFNRQIDFKFIWQLPKELKAPPGAQTTVLDAIIAPTSVQIGTSIFQLEKKDFTINKDGNLEYVFQSKNFNLLSLISWLLGLLLSGAESNVNIKLILDVPTLAKINSSDTSVNNLLTVGKLPPAPLSALQFTTNFYNLDGVLKFSNPSVTATWNSYLSPWNAGQANSQLNGKIDDTQRLPGLFEANGINRVLAGDNYKSRVVQLPIKQVININDYIRSINFFSKDYALLAMQPQINTTNSVVDNRYVDQLNRPHLKRETTYNLSGTTTAGIPYSPVSMKFTQDTLLDLSFDNNLSEINQTINQRKQLTGKFQSEGTSNQFYLKDTQGIEKLLSVTTDGENFIATLPEFANEGIFTIKIGLRNEYGLSKELPLKITVKKEELKIVEISNQVNFGKHTIPNPGDVLTNNNPFSIKILDTYQTTKQWQLLVDIPEPFQTINGDLFPGSPYITASNGEKVLLTKAPTLLYQNLKKNDGEITPINYPANQGISLQVASSNVKTNIEYKGTLNFTLYRGP